MDPKTNTRTTPEAVDLSSGALLDALCICALGWQTEEQHKLYLAANNTVLRHARKLHLQAELRALEQDTSNAQGEPRGQNTP